MNKTTFQTQFTGLSAYFGKDHGKIVIVTYWNALKHLTDEQFTKAVSESIKSCTFFPRVNELLALAPEPLQLENKGSLDWCDNTQRLLENYGSSAR